MSGPPDVARRPERPEDAAFRFALFAEAQGGILQGLDPSLRDLLLRQQFAGQTASYRAAYPQARFDILEYAGAPVGRIVTARADGAVTLVDIALLPERRGRGLGTDLIAELIAEAGAAGLPVRLSVAAHNAGAQRLYRRLGFRFVAGTDGVTLAMEWTPPPIDPRTVPDALRLPLTFDPAPMAAECAALAAGDWTGHFVTANYDGDWSVIPLRGPAGATHPVAMMVSDPARRDYADTPFLAACPAIRATLATFGCPLEAVRLMRLGPGSRIREHRDQELSFEEGTVRLHLPLVTHPGVVFSLNGRRVALEAGSCWYLRLSDPHAVDNPGPGERVHLVVDARVGPAIAALFATVLAEQERARHRRALGMSEPAEADGLTAFVLHVACDRALAERLRPIDDPDALVRTAVAEGAARGYRFTAAEVEAVMHANRHGWVLHPVPILPFPVAPETPPEGRP